MPSSVSVQGPMPTISGRIQNNRRSQRHKIRADKLSLLNQRTPARSTCRITILTLYTEDGLIRRIHHTISGTPDTSPVDLSRQVSRLAPATLSDAGRRAGIFGAEVSIGTTTTSTSTGRLTSTTSETTGSTMPHIAKG